MTNDKQPEGASPDKIDVQNENSIKEWSENASNPNSATSLVTLCDLASEDVASCPTTTRAPSLDLRTVPQRTTPAVCNQECPMTHPNPLSFRRSANFRWGLAALAIAAGPVMSQPTGNPKGTAAPTVEGNSTKSPATRNRDARAQEPGSDSNTKPDSRAARSGNLRTPGVGTAGGLTGRHPGSGTTTGTTQTDQAPAAKP